MVLLLTSCSTTTIPTAGLDQIIDSADMIWLSEHLDTQEKSHLSNWLKGDLIPYVAELEVCE